jgi:hypothetical protein
MSETRKSSLSAPRRRLVALMQAIGFGEILNLTVRAGEPQFIPPPEVIREVRFGSRDEARPHAALGDFAVRVQILELFHQLDILGTGTIESLEIKGGLPFRLRLRGKAVNRESR